MMIRILRFIAPPIDRFRKQWPRLTGAAPLSGVGLAALTYQLVPTAGVFRSAGAGPVGTLTAGST